MSYPYHVSAGFLQDGALAAHLASRSIPTKKDMYWDRAADLYNKWGASGIVSYVERHRDLWASSSERKSGVSYTDVGFRSRSRYDDTIVNGLKVLDFSQYHQRESSRDLLY